MGGNRLQGMAVAFFRKTHMVLFKPITVLTLVFVGVAGGRIAYSQTRNPNGDTTETDRTLRGSIRGRVIMPDGSRVSEAIKVTLQTFRDTLAIVYTENQGQFEFLELAPATYHLEIEADGQRFETVSEAVQVFRGMPSVITISLKTKRSPDRMAPADRAVSVNELEQNVPAKAKKEFDKASAAGNEGRTDEAIAHLRKAISLCPQFVRARNDLGTYLLTQGKLAEAAEELSQAVSLDNKAFYPALNLGIVLVHQQRFAEASDVLTKALLLEANSPAAHLYQGLALVGMGNLSAPEGEFNKAYSLGGAKYGAALFHLGQLYLNRGERNSALKSFEDYLAVVPEARNADQVNKLIAMLRK
jgi:tetratricopeptide (TPR) repeat protein